MGVDNLFSTKENLNKKSQYRRVIVLNVLYVSMLNWNTVYQIDFHYLNLLKVLLYDCNQMVIDRFVDGNFASSEEEFDRVLKIEYD
jgi:hypothetical protein